MHVVTLDSLIRRGVLLKPHEAVAIAQQLIHSTVDVELRTPLGPPTIESVGDPLRWPRRIVELGRSARCV